MITYVKLVCTMVFWGGTFIAGRLLMRDWNPFSAAFARFFVASLFMLWMTMRVEGRFPRITRAQIPGVLLLGATGVFAYNFFFFSGLQTVMASRASVIIACNPVAVALASAVVFREHMSPLRALGIMLSVVGVSFVVTHGHPLTVFSGGVGAGDLLLFGAVASWSTYTIAGKIVMSGLTAFGAVTWSCLTGCLMLLPPALGAGLIGDLALLDVPHGLSVLYLAVLGTGLGFSWFYQGVKAIGASRAAVFINLVPISAIIMSWLFLGDRIDWSLLGGAALVLCGVWLTNRETAVPRPTAK